MNGWFKLDKNIKNHWVYQDAQDLSRWVDLIALANYKTSSIKIKGDIINLERGMFHTTKTNLSKRWGIHFRTADKFLNLLEKEGMITTATSYKGITITIVNYDKYQTQSEGWVQIDRVEEMLKGNLLYDLLNTVPNTVPNTVLNTVPTTNIYNNIKTNKDLEDYKDSEESKTERHGMQTCVHEPIVAERKPIDVSLARLVEHHLGILPSPTWIDKLQSYVDDGITHELLAFAMDKASAKGVRNLKYVTTILEDCVTRGLLTVEQFEYDQTCNKKQAQQTQSDEMDDIMSLILGRPMGGVAQ